MKIVLLAGVLLLAGCATVPDPAGVATAVDRAVGAENAVAAVCRVRPRGAEEIRLQVAARLAFMSRYGSSMTPEQKARYESAMLAADGACSPG